MANWMCVRLPHPARETSPCSLVSALLCALRRAGPFQWVLGLIMKNKTVKKERLQWREGGLIRSGRGRVPGCWGELGVRGHKLLGCCRREWGESRKGICRSISGGSGMTGNLLRVFGRGRRRFGLL